MKIWLLLCLIANPALADDAAEKFHNWDMQRDQKFREGTDNLRKEQAEQSDNPLDEQRAATPTPSAEEEAGDEATKNNPLIQGLPPGFSVPGQAGGGTPSYSMSKDQATETARQLDKSMKNMPSKYSR